MMKKPKYLKIVDLISFLIIVVFFGFGFQGLFLLGSNIHPLITIVIPIGFAKLWYQTVKEVDKEMGYKDDFIK